MDNWSLSTLARGLKKPRIIYANHETSIDDIKEALEKKINGPGSKTENRVFHLHARYLVKIAMCEFNTEGIAYRKVDKKLKKKQLFTSQGPLWIS